MVFASREDAGRKLGLLLQSRGVAVDVVLGLPRGGVVVAAEVARALKVPLDVLVVRKIGHPLQREFAVGALAEQGVVLLNEKVIGNNPIIRAKLQEIAREETERLQEYQARFHRGHTLTLADKSVLLVDDGLATGATTEAAVLSAKKQGARAVIVAAPIASAHAVERLSAVATDVIAIEVDPAFDAVGRYYDEFSQTTDEEVVELLKAA